MKPNRKNPILLAAIWLTLATPSAFAATLYWDVNGTAAGFSTVVGAWNTGTFWNTNSTGGSGGTVTATTTGVDDLIIGPATTNTGTITLTGTKILKSLTFGTTVGAVSLTGGTLYFAGGGGITVASTAGNQIISSNLTVSGNNIINVGTSRTLTLNTGTFTRSAGATVNTQGAGSGSSTMTNLSANDATGIIGTWASGGSGTGTTYAKFSGVNLSGLGYTGTTDGVDALLVSTNIVTGAGNLNYTTAATSGNLGPSASINTLRYTGANGTLGTDTSFTTKGIMNAGTGLLTFSGAVSSGAAGTEMVVNTASNDITFNGSFTGNLTKSGDGVLLMNDTSTGAGTTTVAAGTLGGTGTISGDTTINSGATLTGGTVGGTGNLTFTGNLTAASGSIWLVDLVQNVNGSSDSITVGGNLAIAGSVFTEAFTNTFTYGNKYTIATYTGTQSGVFDYSGAWNDNTERTIGGGQYLIKYADAGAITLTAVPEPGTLGFLAMALGGFFFRRIRKRRAEAAMVASKIAGE